MDDMNERRDHLSSPLPHAPGSSREQGAPQRWPLSGWPHAESPFHDGERAAQQRAGIGDKLEGPGRRLIRDFMPDEHRELFEKLPYLVVGAADDAGRLWATMLAGEPGLVQTPDEQTLRVAALPVVGDPMRELLSAATSEDRESSAATDASPDHSAGVEIVDRERRPPDPDETAGAARRAVGILGIELATRRRNRANGELIAADEHGFTVRVRQSFGNCPQYIQARQPLEMLARGDGGVAPARPQGGLLDDDAVALIRRADTFFLATATPGSLRSEAAGVDVSHRGGRPGFVLVERRAEETFLLVPDYRGNFLFNTIGNLELNPRAGLVFVDFSTGSLLSITGEAEVSWDDPRIAALPGAQRLITVRVSSGVLLPEALPWRWSEPKLAPQLQ
jgi:uncharacterized protein